MYGYCGINFMSLLTTQCYELKAEMHLNCYLKQQASDKSAGEDEEEDEAEKKKENNDSSKPNKGESSLKNPHAFLCH